MVVEMVEMVEVDKMETGVVGVVGAISGGERTPDSNGIFAILRIPSIVAVCAGLDC